MVGSTHYFKQHEPTKFEEILGQDRVVKQVQTAIFAAKKRDENIIPPMLYYGPPGTGKTTLAHITAKEMNRDIIAVPASTLQKCDDLICKFITMKDYSIFFIDEIHRLSSRIEEFIYTVLDGTTVVLDYLKIKPFSFIGATTMPGSLSKPFRDRFSVKAQFSLYSDNDIKEIILHTAKKAKINIDEKCCKVLSFCSRGTPRIALQHLKAVLDCATIRVSSYYEDEVIDISYDDIVEYMQTYDIDKRGLTAEDRKYLKVMVDIHNCGPVGLKPLALSLETDRENVETCIEPFLVRQKLLRKLPRGRILTELGEKIGRELLEKEECESFYEVDII